MKKIFLTALALLFSLLVVNAATYDPTTKVSTIGSNLLTKNGLPTSTFSIVDTETTNSDVATTKKIYILKSKLSYTGNDNEVAAILADELGLIVNSAATKKTLANNVANSILANVSSTNLLNAATMTQKLAMDNISAKDQMNADITAVDLMIAAGYNPLATIVVLGKMEGSVTDTLKGQPNNFKRTMNIYDYISYNYPEKIKAGYACNEYKTFVEYIQPTIDKRKSDKKVLAAFEKEQAQAKKERAKQLLKYKAMNGNDPWNIANTLLQSKTSTK